MLSDKKKMMVFQRSIKGFDALVRRSSGGWEVVNLAMFQFPPLSPLSSDLPPVNFLTHKNKISYIIYTHKPEKPVPSLPKAAPVCFKTRKSLANFLPSELTSETPKSTAREECAYDIR